MAEWRDLSDSELRRRLSQRTVEPALVDLLVADREESYAATRLDELLRR